MDLTKDFVSYMREGLERIEEVLGPSTCGAQGVPGAFHVDVRARNGPKHGVSGRFFLQKGGSNSS